MEEDPEIIYSPFCQVLESGGVTVDVHIYRIEDTDWSLEVVDKNGTSTVWDNEFKTDAEAFEELQKTIREEGIEVLSGDIAGEL